MSGHRERSTSVEGASSAQLVIRVRHIPRAIAWLFDRITTQADHHAVAAHIDGEYVGTVLAPDYEPLRVTATPGAHVVAFEVPTAVERLTLDVTISPGEPTVLTLVPANRTSKAQFLVRISTGGRSQLVAPKWSSAT
jgi:hypothetical protein